MAVQYILPAVLIGFVLDLILGDPVFLLHPVPADRKEHYSS